VASLQTAVPPTRSHHPDVPYQSPVSLGAASYAKIVCSAVFVSGRDVDEARKNSAYFLMAAPDRARPVTVDVDRQARRIRVSLQDITRTAAFYGDQGCVIHPDGHDGVYFTPAPVRTTLPDPGVTGVALRGRALERAVAVAARFRAKVRAAVDLAFADPEGLTAAMVVVYKGQIVAERLHARHHEGHAARKLVDGQEPDRHTRGPCGEGRGVRARRSRAGSRLAAPGRSPRRHPGARPDAHVERS
jgi:hypothetical protein